jgi:hypothetical protein
MTRLNPDKLHVQFAAGATPEGPVTPRCYTLTHSDMTGDLFLTVGPDYDRAQISGWQTRLMRDEVLGEWIDGESGPALHLHCHVSGGRRWCSRPCASVMGTCLTRTRSWIRRRFRFAFTPGRPATIGLKPGAYLPTITWDSEETYEHSDGLGRQRRYRPDLH